MSCATMVGYLSQPNYLMLMGICTGVLLETDPITIASRVSKPPPQDINVKGIDLSEQGIVNAWEFGKRHVLERIR